MSKNNSASKFTNKKRWYGSKNGFHSRWLQVNKSTLCPIQICNKNYLRLNRSLFCFENKYFCCFASYFISYCYVKTIYYILVHVREKNMSLFFLAKATIWIHTYIGVGQSILLAEAFSISSLTYLQEFGLMIWFLENKAFNEEDSWNLLLIYCY